MSRTRISVELLDADGCLYNRQYFRCLNMIVFQHGAFLNKFAKQIPLSNNKKRLIETRFTRIRREIVEYTDDRALSYPQLSGSTIVDTLSDIMRLSVDLDLDVDESIYTFLLAKSNENLIEYIDLRQDNYDQYILMIGSQRQSKPYDREGMISNGTGSIFEDIYFLKYALQKILPGKKISVNRFTVTDVYHERGAGETFSKIIANSPYVRHDVHFYDATKLSILYGAIHHVAVIKPGTDITVHYYDDLKNDYEKKDDILNALFRLFSTYPELLPVNVLLKLHHYTGMLRGIDTIAGKGVIDYRYRENTRLMAKMCGHDLKGDNFSLNIASMLNVEEFLSRRVTGTELVLYRDGQPGLLFSLPRDAIKFMHHGQSDDDQQSYCKLILN